MGKRAYLARLISGQSWEKEFSQYLKSEKDHICTFDCKCSFIFVSSLHVAKKRYTISKMIKAWKTHIFFSQIDGPLRLWELIKCEIFLDLHLQISWNPSFYLRNWRHFLLMLFQWRSLSKTTKLNLLVSFHEEVCINLNFLDYFWLSLSLSLSLSLTLRFKKKNFIS